MAKRVQVVLSEDVLSLGKDGDLVEVAPGYARNFLVPTGKAVPVTAAVLRQVEQDVMQWDPDDPETPPKPYGG